VFISWRGPLCVGAKGLRWARGGLGFFALEAYSVALSPVLLIHRSLVRVQVAEPEFSSMPKNQPLTGGVFLLLESPSWLLM
jgi:hypothetical protein